MSGAGKKKHVQLSSSVSRRVFLRGAGGAALALPLFTDLVPRRAMAASGGTAPPFPKRLVILFSPNGTVPTNFFGPGDTNSLTLGSILQPLAPHRNDLLVLDGIDEEAARLSQGDPHGIGIGGLLTGKKVQSGDLFRSSSGGPGSGWPDNISIDQLIARTVGGVTPFASLELAGKRFATNLWSRMSYRGPADPVTPEDDPQRAWERLFRQPRVAGHRKKILDNTRKELTALSGKLSREDSLKLQQHLAAVTSLQVRLQSASPRTAPCQLPSRPAVTQTSTVIADDAGQQVINPANDVDFPKILKAHFDIVASALACDSTRVASIIMAPSASHLVPSWLTYNDAPFSQSHHEVSVLSDSPDAQAKVTLINAWYAQQIADFITSLKAIPEGAGTLFDSTLVVWLNELGTGYQHTHTRIPVMMAGSAQGTFKTGRYIKYPSGTSMNDLLVSLANAMGVTPVATDASGAIYQNRFGDPALCTGPLPGLTA